MTPLPDLRAEVKCPSSDDEERGGGAKGWGGDFSSEEEENFDWFPQMSLVWDSSDTTESGDTGLPAEEGKWSLESRPQEALM